MISALLPPDEPRRLQALLRLGLLDTPAEERFDRIVRMAARMFQVPISLVSLLDESRQWFKARVGLDTHESNSQRRDSLCRAARGDRSPLGVDLHRGQMATPATAAGT